LLEQVNFSNGVSHHRLLARHESEGTQASGSKLKPGERKPPQKSLDEALSLTPEEIIQKLKKGEYVSLEAEINNTHLSTGAHLAGEIVHEFVLNKLTACKNDLPRGADGSLDPDAVAAAIANFQFEMPKEDALSVTFTGYGGQSFGAWLVEGMRFELQGFGNDYVGKGMRGGKIIIHSAAGSMMAAAPHEHEIAGSTILMGATGGRMYIAGTVRERFAVRNSGAVAVVEGVGDNGCEYMTGGAVAVLGKTGHDFATGMSGGVAFIYDEDGTADQRINKTDVEIFTLRDEHIAKKLGYQVNEFEANLREMVQSQLEETGSARAAHILANWDMERDKFRMILPKEVINLSNHRNKYQLQLPQLFRGRPCCVEVPASAPALAA